MSKTLIFSLVVLALAGLGVLLATNAGAGGTDTCCPGMARPAAQPRDCGGCCPAGDKAPATQPAAAGTVNDRCPIMGGKIDPAAVPANLTREFNGEKVGFCCGGCPAAWDKLPDAQKEAKLSKVKIGN
ncbi:MAG: hypothetical protein NTV86_12915 [Planctomycetota bacterium]|nr:hypothetical protein [Planctomycetota bacterium]